MVATNSVAPRTGNVSAGTSIFAMVVLERELSRVHRELDLVTTPAGDLVAMVHCNNGASELNAWVGLFAEFARALGVEADTSTIFETLFRAALDGAPDCGGLMAYNYLSGEPITELHEGRPLFLRSPDGAFDLATFMRTQLFASLATLRIGMDVLQKDEGVRLDRMFAHGGLFKTKGVAQRFLAAAIDTPVSVGDVAAEGGAWGIAVLAAFSRRTNRRPESGRLPEHRGLRRHRARYRRSRSGRRRRIRRLHPALRGRAARGTSGRRAQLRPDRALSSGHDGSGRTDRADWVRLWRPLLPRTAYCRSPGLRAGRRRNPLSEPARRSDRYLPRRSGVRLGRRPGRVRRGRHHGVHTGGDAHRGDGRSGPTRNTGRL